MHFEDMVLTAEKWIPIIQNKEKPDMIVGLFHSGFDHSYGGASESEENNENASVLVAKRVKGFDLIMIGHDHQKHNDWIVNNFGDSVLIMDPRSSARNIAVATITFKRNGRHYDKNIESEILNVADYESDMVFDENFRKILIKYTTM